MQKDVHVIAGPTASGKSARALEIARQLNGEIINADSIQLYEDLPILTARPTATDTEAIPHHLYGFLTATDTMSAATWQKMALQKIDDLHKQSKIPILVGGTGFYLKALIEGLSPIPESDPDIRVRLTDLQKNIGTPALHQQLNAKDPVMGARLNPNDTQRVMRALEVLEATGKSLSYFQGLLPEKPPANLNFTVTILMPERDELYARCDKRFLQMLDMGALEEVRQYLSRNPPNDAPVTRALGYHALKEHLQGNISLDTAITQSQQETRNYAKRQTTWFKNQKLT